MQDHRALVKINGYCSVGVVTAKKFNDTGLSVCDYESMFSVGELISAVIVLVCATES